MAEAPPRQSPLEPQRLAHGPHVSASLAPYPPAARFIFRGAQDVAEIAGARFGVDLPAAACRANQADGRAALWLGPDEWLLLAAESAAADIETTLCGALAGQPHALVSIGHRNTALTLAGPDAPAVLSAGCPLDLHENQFPVGMCTRTVLAKAEIVLWRTGAQAFHLETWRSFAPYVWDFLIEARTRL